MAARPRCACARAAESVDRGRAPIESIRLRGGPGAASTRPGWREEHRAKDPALPSAESWIPARPRGALGGTAPPGGRRRGCRAGGAGAVGGREGGSVWGVLGGTVGSVCSCAPHTMSRQGTGLTAPPACACHALHPAGPCAGTAPSTQSHAGPSGSSAGHTLQSQPSRSTHTNRTWGKTAGSGPAVLLNPVSPRLPWRGARGGLIRPRGSCQCRWTCSCTRRSAAAPHRPWPWQGEPWVTAMMGTENLRLPSPHLSGHSPEEGLESLDGNPNTSPTEWGASLSPA